MVIELDTTFDHMSFARKYHPDTTDYPELPLFTGNKFLFVFCCCEKHERIDSITVP